MAEFNLHARLVKSEAEDATPILEPFAEENDAVTLTETQQIDQSPDPEIVTPNEYLEIEGIEEFADVYTSLNGREEIADLALWGPTADRFPIPVEHYALQQIGNPELYEFHALDGQVTLVIAESKEEFMQLREEVPSAALG